MSGRTAHVAQRIAPRSRSQGLALCARGSEKAGRRARNGSRAWTERQPKRRVTIQRPMPDFLQGTGWSSNARMWVHTWAAF